MIIIICLILVITTTSVSQGSAGQPSEKGGINISLLEAVKTTVSKHPQIRIQERQVDISLGVVTAAKGQFDVTFSSDIEHSFDHLSEDVRNDLGDDGPINTTSYSTGFRKQFRSGTTFTSGFEVLRLDQESDGKSALSSGRVNFVIIQPLLRGRGKESTAAIETASKIDHDESRLNLRHTIARLVHDTVEAYWNYLAARDNLKIHKEAEIRAVNLLKDTIVLIDKGETPAAEITQLRANLAQKSSTRIIAEQSQFNAGQSLGLAMGLDITEILSISEPKDPFPEIPNFNDLPELSDIVDKILDIF